MHHRFSLRAVLSFLTIVLLVGTFATGAAQAQAGPNALLGLYTVTPFLDFLPGMPVGVPQTICFLASGAWYSPGGFLGVPWSGQQFQKGAPLAAGNGNTVKGVGNFLGGLGNDSFKVEMLTAGIATGSWNQWLDVPPLGLTGPFSFQVALTFVGPICPPPLVVGDDTKSAPDVVDPADLEKRIPFLAEVEGAVAEKVDDLLSAPREE